MFATAKEHLMILGFFGDSTCSKCNLLTSSSDCWVFLCVVVGSLPYKIKCLHVTVVI